MAYFSFGAAWVWTLGYLLTSDWLRKLNPNKWSKRRQKRASGREWILFRLASVGLPIGVTCLFALAIYGVYSERLKRELSSLQGWLAPANDSSPPIFCRKPIPQDALKIYLGSNLAYTTQFPHVVLEVKKEPKITLDRNDRGEIALTMDVYDQDDNIVAEIVKNEFTINRNNHFKIIRKDKSSLIVMVPKRKQEVFNIRYLNSSTIKILGVLRYPGEPSAVIISEQFLELRWQRYTEACLSAKAVDISID